MVISSRYLVQLAGIVFCAWLIVVCSAAPASAAEPETGEPAPPVSRLQGFTTRASELALQAMSMIGIRYKYGGNAPENGLDCSGLVRYVYKEVLGKELPRTSVEISRVGTQVDRTELQPGDLVFYNTLRRGFSHVGIYLGDNKFIHSPSAGGKVRIESMDVNYWKKRFNGARRITQPSEE
jgi:cell wall-associated NlpC family hydrolase